MKKNLLITFFLTAIITHFSLYCSERPKKPAKTTQRKQLEESIKERWERLLALNPYQAVPMRVAPAQPAPAQPIPVFKAAPPVQGFPSVQPIPAAPQHILAVQATPTEELPYYQNVLVPGNTPPATQSGTACSCCGKPFWNDRMLKTHMRNAHGELITIHSKNRLHFKLKK